MTGYDILLGPLATVTDRKEFARLSAETVKRTLDDVPGENDYGPRVGAMFDRVFGKR